MTTISFNARSLFLADYEIRTLRTKGAVEILRSLDEAPLCQRKAQLLADCPFGPTGRTFYVREDFQQLGQHRIYRADFSPAEQARMAPWLDASQMKEWHARLSVEVRRVDVGRGGPSGYQWKIEVRHA